LESSESDIGIELEVVIYEGKLTLRMKISGNESNIECGNGDKQNTSQSNETIDRGT